MVDETYRTHCQIHTPLEPHGCVAKWDRDRLTVWESTQGVYNISHGLGPRLRATAQQCPGDRSLHGRWFRQQACHREVHAHRRLARETNRTARQALPDARRDVPVHGQSPG